MTRAKHLLTLSFLLLGLSCNDLEDTPVVSEPDNTPKKEVIEHKETIPERITNGRFSFLGVSYDITDEYLGIGATKRLVVNLQDYLDSTIYKNAYAIDPSSRGYTTVYSGATALDFLENLTSKADVNAKRATDVHYNNDFGLIVHSTFRLSTKSLGYPGDVDQKETYSTRYSYARADIVRVLKTVKFNARPHMLQPYVYPAFLEDLQNYTPDEFVQMYGTHVLLNVTLGERIQFNYRSEIADEHQWEKRRIVEAGLLTAMMEFSTPGGFSSSETGKNAVKNTGWNVNARYREDANTYVSVLFGSNTKSPTPLNTSTWGHFLNESNAVIVDIDWRYAYLISDFIADPVKKAEIETAIKQYMTQQAKLL